MYQFGGHVYCLIPADKKHSAIVGSILGQRRRRWTNIEQTMAQTNVDLPKQTRDVDPMSVYCWDYVADCAPTTEQRIALAGTVVGVSYNNVIA